MIIEKEVQRSSSPSPETKPSVEGKASPHEAKHLSA